MTRSVIDFCILPGTAVGAEILYLYSLQWKNRLSLFTIALVSFAYSHAYMSIEQKLFSQKPANEPENIR
jgi:hypothetical protein